MLTTLSDHASPRLSGFLHLSSEACHPFGGAQGCLPPPPLSSSPRSLHPSNTGSSLWNVLSWDVCMVLSLSSFRSLLRCHLLSKIYTDTLLKFPRNSTPMPAHTLFSHSTYQILLSYIIYLCPLFVVCLLLLEY